MKKSVFRFYFILATMTLSLVGFTSCSSDDDDNDTSTTSTYTYHAKYEYKCNTTMLEFADVTITYLDADGVSQTKTMALPDTVWTVQYDNVAGKTFTISVKHTMHENLSYDDDYLVRLGSNKGSLSYWATSSTASGMFDINEGSTYGRSSVKFSKLESYLNTINSESTHTKTVPSGK